MNTMTVGVTSFPIYRAFPHRYQSGLLVLEISAPKTEEFGADELQSILHDNHDVIVVTEYDSEGEVARVEKFAGYGTTCRVSTDGSTLTAEVECTSEAERKIAILELKAVEQGETIATQNETIAMYDSCLLEIADEISSLKGE